MLKTLNCSNCNEEYEFDLFELDEEGVGTFECENCCCENTVTAKIEFEDFIDENGFENYKIVDVGEICVQ